MTAEEWPVDLDGVTESVVTTLGPNGRWNAAALGLHAGDPVTATTWGNTRTRRNFDRQGGGYVQFTRDPVLFVEAALSIRETADPVLDAADAWVEVAAERVGAGEDGGTRWERWELRPLDAGVEREAVPTTNRGYYAVVEATVAASRLDVDSYDTAALRDRLAYFEEVVGTCGGERERAAFDRLNELAGWKSQNESF
ncbi:DUF447 domain-containing protein [Halostella litorea]|uniref:DUF447 domain-containing protein n=1 Tax=Halostella litorea TaxID=2528831 RepID=UPI001091D4F9|nr:DUF447 domain-containing protein [Halostella litorea]